MSAPSPAKKAFEKVAGQWITIPTPFTFTTTGAGANPAPEEGPHDTR